MYIVTINKGYKDETIYQCDTEIMAKGCATKYGWLMGGDVSIKEVSDKEAEKQKRLLKIKNKKHE